MKDCCNSMNSILYAPGRNNDMSVLSAFRDCLGESFPLKILDLKFDEGSFEPSRFREIVENDSDWWIGISLGASFLYYVWDIAVIKPARLTLINPFSSRKILSYEKHFDMKDQWDFTPKNKRCNVECIDVVISLYDHSVPIYHGLELLNQTEAQIKNLICISSNHQIPELTKQKELAAILVNLAKGYPGEKQYMYCNVYQWQRAI